MRIAQFLYPVNARRRQALRRATGRPIGVELLQRPYRRRALAGMIRAALDRTQRRIVFSTVQGPLRVAGTDALAVARLRSTQYSARHGKHPFPREAPMIRNLQHLAVQLPDLEAGRRFYETFGLQAVQRGNQLVLRCLGRDQDQLILTEGSARRTGHVSFGTTPAGLAEAKAKLEAQGTRLLDRPDEHAPGGLWFRDPDGTLINLQAAEAAATSAPPGERMNSPGDFRRVGVRGVPARGTPTRPRRLGHVLLFTPDVQRAVAFYTGTLGMRLSDTAGGGVAAFLRTAGDSDHHVLAFARSERRGLHHASFEVGSLDEIYLGAERMVAAGYRSAWGLGRHAIGSNFFHYLRDPWNGLVEYFWDIDYVPESAKWEARDWGVEEGFFLWSASGPPPADFIQNFEQA